MLQQGRSRLVALLDGDEEVCEGQHHLGIVWEMSLPDLHNSRRQNNKQQGEKSV